MTAEVPMSPARAGPRACPGTRPRRSGLLYRGNL